MRQRTDEKRQAIMEAARAAFGEKGYAGASMVAIASRAGASKQTLYSYFESKEDLFSAVMLEAMETQADALFALLDNETGDIRSRLEEFGRAYVDFVMLPEILSLIRVAVTVGWLGTLGPRLYEQGPLRGWGAVAAALERWAGEGHLAITDPAMAAFQLRGLLEAGLVEPCLYNAPANTTPEAAVRQGLDVFLAAYGVQAAAPTGGAD